MHKHENLCHHASIQTQSFSAIERLAPGSAECPPQNLALQRHHNIVSHHLEVGSAGHRLRIHCGKRPPTPSPAPHAVSPSYPSSSPVLHLGQSPQVRPNPHHSCPKRAAGPGGAAVPSNHWPGLHLQGYLQAANPCASSFPVLGLLGPLWKARAGESLPPHSCPKSGKGCPANSFASTR